MSYIQGYDPDTLREKVDPRQCKDRLNEIGEQRSLPALLERVWLLKVLDLTDDALILAEQAVRVARMAGTRKDLLRSRILHASVETARGSFTAAEQELTVCVDEAEGQGWNGIAAFGYQHRGRAYFAAGELDLARADFKRTLFLRQETDASDAQVESTLMAIDAVDRRRAAASVAS